MKGVKNSSNAMTTRVEYINKGEYQFRLQTARTPNETTIVLSIYFNNLPG